MASLQISLEKCQAVRPNRVGEVSRQTIVKAVLQITDHDVEKAAAPPKSLGELCAKTRSSNAHNMLPNCIQSHLCGM